ncbi:MAG: right-handed parallel beta-helix repeat-containing protein [Deltaproteobacteria bacterium]|nr:right-handed parallel beta-helix repeat-containing protein [Deltaproteobacteria bacterium]
MDRFVSSCSTPPLLTSLAVASIGACSPLPAEPADLALRSTTFEVNDTADLALLATAPLCECITAVDKVCTLRAAVQAANACPGPDDIVFMVSGTYTLSLGAATDESPASGDLDITESVTISAAVATPMSVSVSATVDGAHLDRIFDVQPESAPVTLAGFKVMRGEIDPSAHPQGDAHGGCIRVRSSTLILDSMIIGGDADEGCAGHHGGGVYAEASSLTISDSIVADNEAKAWIQGLTIAEGLGGGIHAHDTTLSMVRTQLLENRASGGGGGIATISASSLSSLSDVLIHGNETFDAGGGGYMGAPFTMVDSVVSDNFITEGAGQGGGLFLAPSESGTSSVILRTQVYENTAPQGGGIALDGQLDITDSDVHFNHAAGGTGSPQGGGIWGSVQGLLFIERSSIHGNTAGDGAGLFIRHMLRATNTTIADNEADIAGGGLYGDLASWSELMHCTVRNNTALAGAGGGTWLHASATASFDRSVLFGNAQALGTAECVGPVTTPTVAVSDPLGCMTPSGSVVTGSLNGWGPLAYGPNSTAAFTITLPNSALSTAAPCGVSEDQWGQPREEECDVGAYEDPSN